MNFRLYIKIDGNDTGQVLAAVGQTDDRLIDNFVLYVFKDRLNTVVTEYVGENMKVDQPGRLLWTQITNIPNQHWEEITNILYREIDFPLCAKAITDCVSNEDLIRLKVYFK